MQEQHSSSKVTGPSSLYRAGIWQVGLSLVRALPLRVCVSVSQILAEVYWIVVKHRRQIVTGNVLPAFGEDLAAARKTAHKLFRQFSRKIVDLWRYEAGLPIEDLFGEYSGWEHFVQAQEQKRGVLLVTPHLGNWEFGAPWLAQRGVKLLVITLAEPTAEFTKLRQESRGRWNVETLVIGEDPFGFLEIIKRLEQGATVALLMDRPPPATAVTVELFGRPFLASMAAAELARASGCMLVPVYLPRTDQGYAAHVLPAVTYNRSALRDRDARQKLTQEIMKFFEPVIRQHLDQWYHFVPLWHVSSSWNEATSPDADSGG
jgi:KDO2-lipid IV(A) lauroyltransferase